MMKTSCQPPDVSSFGVGDSPLAQTSLPPAHSTLSSLDNLPGQSSQSLSHLGTACCFGPKQYDLNGVTKAAQTSQNPVHSLHPLDLNCGNPFRVRLTGEKSNLHRSARPSIVPSLWDADQVSAPVSSPINRMITPRVVLRLGQGHTAGSCTAALRRAGMWTEADATEECNEGFRSQGTVPSQSPPAHRLNV